MDTVRKSTMDELERVSVVEFKTITKNPIVIILDNIRSLMNVGSVFRTSDAFKVEKIILCGITGTPPHREINKTALGATESVDWYYQESTWETINQLKMEGYFIIAIEQVQGSIALNNFMPEPDQKYAFVFGNEVEGVKPEVVEAADLCIEIPQFGTKHSMNISVTAGIVLWDVCTKLNK